MAAVNAQALAEGFIPSAQAAILAAVTVTTIIPEGGIALHNINAASQTVLLYIKRDGTARPLGRAVLEQNYSALSESVITLESGDSLEAVTTTASAVHFAISGGEEV